MRVSIVRLEDGSEGCLGAVLLNDKLFCVSLEPDSQDPVKPRIPAGVYSCRRFHGTKFTDTFEILVSGHTAVLFHPGNTETDTDMCVLLGQYASKLRANRAILNSGNTFRLFMDTLKGLDNFTTEFIDLYGYFQPF